MATSVAVQDSSVKQPVQVGDAVARLVTLIFASIILIVAVLLVFELWKGSAPARQKLGWSFLFNSQWNPVTDEFGALPFIYGTVVTSVVALCISIPLGVGAAIFLSELAPVKISNSLTFLVELLAAVPSVIYGLLAIFTLVPLMRNFIAPFLKAT